MTKEKVLFILVCGLALLVIANTLFLDYTVFFNRTPHIPLSLPPSLIVQSTPTPTAEPKSAIKVVDSCYPRSCIDLIKEATSALKPQISTAPVAVQPVSSTAREFTVQLGSGSNNTDDWQDVPGVEAYIDSTKYGTIKDVYFEASLHTPTGNQTAYVRLYNATDKYYVWPTEMSIEGGEPKLLVSPSFALPSGNKLYRVQMKTQLKATTNLVQARVRIIAQ